MKVPTAELLGQGQRHLILVIDGVSQEGDQLAPGALNLKNIDIWKQWNVYEDLSAHPQRERDDGRLLDTDYTEETSRPDLWTQQPPGKKTLLLGIIYTHYKGSLQKKSAQKS